MLYLGVDLGTSSMKVLLVDGKGTVLRSTSQSYPLMMPQPGWSEQDPEEWWSALCVCVPKLLEGIDATQVAGLSFGGQMHGLVALDENDQVIRPAILWNDGRTGKQTDALNNDFGKEGLLSLTGNLAFAGFTAPKLLWMRENEPELFAKIRKIMLPKDYLAYRLTGVHSCDYSDAAGMLLLDVANRCWSKPLMEYCGVTEEQIESEISDIMDIAKSIYATFGLTYTAELSTRPDDFMGDIALWDKAEASLKSILTDKFGADGFEINEGDGAFYGPKIDLGMRDCLGRQWQMGTIQLDFQLPLNFNLKYVAPDGSLKQPVMIHRAIFRSFERFIGILIEHFKGQFPLWLSPVQVAVVPIRPEHNDYAKKIADLLLDNDIRFEVDYSDQNMKNKIKRFKLERVPYVLVVGDKEAENETVAVNIRGVKDNKFGVPLAQFIDNVKAQQKQFTLELNTEF